MRIDLLDENLFRGRADDLLTDRPALEEKEGGNAVDAVLLGQLRLLIDVDFDDLDLVGQFTGDFIKKRGDHLARTTPFGPKVDDGQLFGLDDFTLEIESAYRRNIRTHWQ